MNEELGAMSLCNLSLTSCSRESQMNEKYVAMLLCNSLLTSCGRAMVD